MAGRWSGRTPGRGNGPRDGRTPNYRNGYYNNG